MLKLRVAAVLIALTLTSVVYGRQCTFDPTQHSTGTFDGCPQTGKGGDTSLNKLKNRDEPPSAYKTYTVNDLISNLPQDLPTTRRIHWDAAESDDACTYEQEGATVIGYLLGVKQEGPEACNCRNAAHRDYHLWLVGTSTDTKDNSVVIEISPRLLGSHPNWNKSAIQHLVKQKSKIRISGWLMWDEEHDDQVGKSRGTHWEIHPIHKIEVFSAGKWTEL
jgi:hypothetical protein